MGSQVKRRHGSSTPTFLELELYTSEKSEVSSVQLTRWVEGKQDRAFLLACEEEEDWRVEDAGELWKDELERLPLFWS